MKQTFLILGLIFTTVFIVLSCDKKQSEEEANKELYRQLTSVSFTYYQGDSDTVLSGAGPSPHGSFKLKFNPIAMDALDANTGKLPSGGTFPEGSLIVKEVFNGSSLSLYAVMKKDPSSEFAGKDWVWAEYNPDGSTIISVGENGDGCTGCHGGTPNRDLTRSFDLH